MNRVQALLVEYQLAQERIAAGLQAYWQSTAVVGAFGGAVAAALIYILSSDRFSLTVQKGATGAAWFIMLGATGGLVVLVLAMQSTIVNSLTAVQRVEDALDLGPGYARQRTLGGFVLHHCGYLFLAMGFLIFVAISAGIVFLELDLFTNTEAPIK